MTEYAPQRKLLLAAAAMTLAACVSPTDESDVTDAAPQSISIMTFNVENLFDNADDPGKDDRSYFAAEAKNNDEHKSACATIPVKNWRNQCLDLDWSDEVIHNKLAAIAGAVLQAGNGRGPDILVVQEVENIAILERLRIEFLDDAGYLPSILIEGEDLRGIDVAFLSRLPMAEAPKLHPFPVEGIDPKRREDTRGILQATFTLPDDSLLTGYAVHFPAPFHPTDMRVAAYNQLNELKSTLPADRQAFAAGDFNTTSREDREHDMLARFARPYWTVVHEQACENCRGTYYYARDGSWSFLDMILWSPAVRSGNETTWSIRASSVAIANEGPHQKLENDTPASFEALDGTGVSDHWPLVFTLELK